MFSKILLAFDGSSYAEKALGVAIDLSRKYGAKLIALHVVLRRVYAISPSEAGLLTTGAFVREMEAEGKALIAKLEDRLKGEGVSFETRLSYGVPAEEILRVANEEKVELIVMGSRGLTEVKAFLLGSVSDRVSHHAKIPVLIIK